jgi:hypothetical protein
VCGLGGHNSHTAELTAVWDWGVDRENLGGLLDIPKYHVQTGHKSDTFPFQNNVAAPSLGLAPRLLVDGQVDSPSHNGLGSHIGHTAALGRGRSTGLLDRD